VFLGSPALLAPERADGRAGAASSTLSTLKRVLTPAPQPTRSAQAANEAIAAIQQLHAMKDANAAALALSRATRIYLADRYSIDATRMTSSQILVGLPRLTDQNRSAVETILLGTDRLKFAADGAAASTVEQLASVFQDLVHRTAVRELAIHDLPVGVHNG
jgi:hypothetical protein